MRHRRTVAAALLVVAMSGRAAGDITHLKSPSTVHTDGGTDLRLPPGYFLDEPTWGSRDIEMKRLQDAETRLDAENKSLRKSASEWQPGWVTLVTTLVVGAGLGVYVATKL